MMGHANLGTYYKTHFSLMNHHHWSLRELDEMMPWEKYLYIDMLQVFLEEQEKQRQEAEREFQNQIRAKRRR